MVKKIAVQVRRKFLRDTVGVGLWSTPHCYEAQVDKDPKNPTGGWGFLSLGGEGCQFFSPGGATPRPHNQHVFLPPALDTF